MKLDERTPTAFRAAAPGRRQALRRRLSGHGTLAFIVTNALPVALVVAWWLAGDDTFPPYILPPLEDVVEDIQRLLIGDLTSATLTSLWRIGVACVIAILAGAVLTTLSEILPITDGFIGRRLLPLLNSVPVIGWAILGVTWLGATDKAVILVVILILVPFSMVTLREGIRGIDPDLKEMGRSFSRNRFQVFLRVESPLLLPYIVASARLSFSVGWKVATVAELFGATEGIGFTMNSALQSFDNSLVYACILTVVIYIVAFDKLLFDPISNLVSKKMGTRVAPRRKVQVLG